MPLPQDVQREYHLALSVNHSIKGGNKALVEALLAAGAPVNGSNLLEYRPLTFTALCGGVDLARLLIERGADLNAGVVEHVLNDAGRLSVRKGTTALTMSIRNCHLDVFRSLVDAGADLNAADDSGFTPLMSASQGVEEAEKGVVMAEALLQAGADPTIANDQGCIALTYAAGEGSPDVVDMLLEKAPKTVSHVTFAGATPLYAAVRNGNTEGVVRLLAAGAVQPARYRKSFCPLTYAIVDNNEQLLRILLRHSKAVGGEAAIRYGLEVAVIERRAKLLHLVLLAEGQGRQERLANCTLPGRGRILHFAATRGSVGTLGVLLSAGADATQVFDGRTASEAVQVSSPDGCPAPDEQVAAMRRMLLRAPAFRARSWAWPVGVTARATSLPRGGAGGASEFDGARCGRAQLAAAIRIYRPKKKTFILRHVGRYS